MPRHEHLALANIQRRGDLAIRHLGQENLRAVGSNHHFLVADVYGPDLATNGLLQFAFHVKLLNDLEVFEVDEKNHSIAAARDSVGFLVNTKGVDDAFVNLFFLAIFRRARSLKVSRIIRDHVLIFGVVAGVANFAVRIGQFLGLALLIQKGVDGLQLDPHRQELSLLVVETHVENELFSTLERLDHLFLFHIENVGHMVVVNRRGHEILARLAKFQVVDAFGELPRDFQFLFASGRIPEIQTGLGADFACGDHIQVGVHCESRDIIDVGSEEVLHVGFRVHHDPYPSTVIGYIRFVG